MACSNDFTAPMSVVAWFCGSDKTAFKALLSLQGLHQTGRLQSVGVVDAAVMSECSGKIRLDRSIEFRAACDGRLSVIFPSAVLDHAAASPEVDEVAEHFSALGLRVNLLREIGENMTEDGSALVILLEEDWFGELRGIFEGEADVERWSLEVASP